MPESPKPLHFAVEVAYDLPSLNSLVEEHIEKAYADASSPLCPINDEWPERVFLNSRRLRDFIEAAFCKGQPTWNGHGPFHILRPYKMLSFLETGIRKRIADLHQARRVIWDAHEDEYMALYQRNPVEDGEGVDYQQESKMTLEQLTAHILDLRCLERVMDVFSRPEFCDPKHMPSHVPFNNLWFLFPVGSLIYVRDPNIPQNIWRVIQRTGGRKYRMRPDHVPLGEYEHLFSDFVIDSYHLDYDGIRYRPTFHQFKISSFDGAQLMSSLPVLPFRYVEYVDERVNRDDLLERARQFKSMTRIRHQSYSGRSYDRTPSGKRLSDLEVGSRKNVTRYSERIDSEVVVDFERALQDIPSWIPGGEDFKPYQMDTKEHDLIYVDQDEMWDSRFTEDFMEAETKKWKKWEEEALLSGPTEEEDLLLLPDRVFAFVLRTRSWACLEIGKDMHGNQSLTDVQLRDEPWENLELPVGHKEIVHALVDSHFSKDKSKNIQFDLVSGKGNGVIILLHGVPGVGKTSTAECAAQSYGRPLLPITCGDLGLTPAEVESGLQDIFRLAQAWDCVMLLDEADIFLAQRTPTDIERNALVSVFLRTLEYYEGILFLTTNRVGVFDEAFKSRIHLSLYYPPLTKDQTISIWRSHIATAKKESRIEVNDVDLVLYAQEIFQRQSDPQFGPVWNGRQIRNAFQIAVALAGFHSKGNRCIKLEPKHFSQVFNVSDQFSSYVWLVKQRNSDAQWNAMQMLRRDDWAYAGPPGVNPATNNQQGAHVPPRFSNFPQSSFGQQAGPSRSTAPFSSGMGTGGMVTTGGGAVNQFGNIQTTSSQQWHTGNIHYPLPVGQSNANLRLQPTPSTGMENSQQRLHCQEQSQSYAQPNPSHQQGLVQLNQLVSQQRQQNEQQQRPDALSFTNPTMLNLSHEVP
ncbi:hypothetical protein F5144DRAFT_642131 [Chaetomium tenue]|uniref:Uncharacterized protein n=1 Tax=Chaetomium tenue TaxID=1854479 RepID=A0ACB7PHY4_9PEZI|nr:hypothetical protein F5144DRAFT_642131 [Chaetomium globosum]